MSATIPRTCHSYPEHTLTGSHNTDNIQLCVYDPKTQQAVGMTYDALEEIGIVAKAQWPLQPLQLVRHTCAHYSYIYTHKHKDDLLSKLLPCRVIGPKLEKPLMTLNRD